MPNVLLACLELQLSSQAFGVKDVRPDAEIHRLIQAAALPECIQIPNVHDLVDARHRMVGRDGHVACCDRTIASVELQFDAPLGIHRTNHGRESCVELVLELSAT